MQKVDSERSVFSQNTKIGGHLRQILSRQKDILDSQPNYTLGHAVTSDGYGPYTTEAFQIRVRGEVDPWLLAKMAGWNFCAQRSNNSGHLLPKRSAGMNGLQFLLSPSACVAESMRSATLCDAEWLAWVDLPCSSHSRARPIYLNTYTIDRSPSTGGTLAHNRGSRTGRGKMSLIPRGLIRTV